MAVVPNGIENEHSRKAYIYHRFRNFSYKCKWKHILKCKYDVDSKENMAQGNRGLNSDHIILMGTINDELKSIDMWYFDINFSNRITSHCE